MSAIPRKLVEGFQRFREQHFERNDSLYQQLVKEGLASGSGDSLGLRAG
jgi:hypothetical protein